MRTLEFEVNKQFLRRKPDCDFNNIVAGSSGYLKAKFYFSEFEWKDCKKVASFWKDGKEYPVLLNERDICVIPAEVLGGDFFEVQVTGARLMNYKIKTTKIRVKQEVF